MLVHCYFTVMPVCMEIIKSIRTAMEDGLLMAVQLRVHPQGIIIVIVIVTAWVMWTIKLMENAGELSTQKRD